MLKISVKPHESLLINRHLEVKVKLLSIDSHQALLGLNLPKNTFTSKKHHRCKGHSKISKNAVDNAEKNNAS